ncbi:MAG: acetate--CoA ligase [Chloroflexota bacterium]|jgi:acetyl-CoA synthetase|nr:acetate--CoA ligase [Chloroflexota bacterium]MDH5242594.1 acetate--CoA ligase [Chloroflexota bacterium]
MVAMHPLDALCAAARADPERFWGEVAEDIVPWFRRPDRVLVHEPPTFRWFEGGRTNMAWTALDHQVEQGRGEQVALIAADERGGRRRWTYRELLDEVRSIAAALRGLGVGRGDRVTIYMPTTVEAIATMLAVVRIGAIHSVVFAGFGAGALGNRIRASGSRVVVAADLTYRKGKDVPLEGIVDAALRDDPGSVDVIVMHRRGSDRAGPASGNAPPKLDWDDFISGGAGHPDRHEEMESNEPAYILATSGTTATPKLAVHTHGGNQVQIAAMGQWLMGLRAGEVWWSMSDIGWIVGHSYIVYAPLMAGVTTIAYEGALDHPGPDATWALIEELGVQGLFTSPTGVRLLMRAGAEPARAHDLSSLERIFCAGEVLNAPAWRWLTEEVFEGRVPVIDNMWQTETGGPIFGNPYGLGLLPIKPGSAGVPLPGTEAAVVGPDGEQLPAGQKGIMVLRRPFPGLIATLWGEPERYATDYWSRIPGSYYVGDAAHIDEDGYVWFSGRADEIIKIAAHRLGTIEVESAFLRHPGVAEAGVTGRPDELRGEVIAAFIVLRAGYVPSDDLRSELLATLRDELGPIAVVGELSFVDMLPKTRSGKIMRRVLKAVVAGVDPGDITTIEDGASVDEARAAIALLKDGAR